jgi:hypothetical protein
MLALTARGAATQVSSKHKALKFIRDIREEGLVSFMGRLGSQRCDRFIASLNARGVLLVHSGHLNHTQRNRTHLEATKGHQIGLLCMDSYLADDVNLYDAGKFVYTFFQFFSLCTGGSAVQP